MAAVYQFLIMTMDVGDDGDDGDGAMKPPGKGIHLMGSAPWTVWPGTEQRLCSTLNLGQKAKKWSPLCSYGAK